MEDHAPADPEFVGVPDLLDLCRRFNEAGVRYVIYGGMACLLHGFERMTKDIDVFVGEDRGNIANALKTLSSWGEGYAQELSVEDVLDSVVVRIFDRFILDVASKVWKLEWDEAYVRRRIVRVEDVDIPVLSRADLITSKRTYRDRDAIDVRELSILRNPEPGVAAGES
jgi:hypothetical protein